MKSRLETEAGFHAFLYCQPIFIESYYLYSNFSKTIVLPSSVK